MKTTRILTALVMILFLLFSMSNTYAATNPTPVKPKQTKVIVPATPIPTAVPTPTPYYNFYSMSECQIRVIDRIVTKRINYIDPYGNSGNIGFDKDSEYNLLIVVLQIVKPSSLPIKINLTDISLVSESENNNPGVIYKCPAVGVTIIKSIPSDLKTIYFKLANRKSLYEPGVGIYYDESNDFISAFAFDIDKYKNTSFRIWLSKPIDQIVEPAAEVTTTTI